jgi:hypothetical protein
MLSSRYSCYILTNLKFSRQIFKKKTETLNFIKIRPVGTDLFHADGQTDTRKVIVVFRNI